MATIPNIDPFTSALVFKKEIMFSTTDEISGQNITEGYNVSGPTNSTINPITLTGGKKCVVPITSDNGSGAPYLKFHFPNGTSGNKTYLTFAVKNSNMEDGYYDYTTGIPAAYRSKLKQFIVSHLTPTQQANANGTKTKELRFTTYGSSTNKPAEAIVFYFTFSAVFNGLSTEVANNVGVELLTLNQTTGGGGIPITGFPGPVESRVVIANVERP
jgi:hypothetical protein